ncbi:MAG TPA: cyclopropane-fatty-acyl-phospholipid synthase family protein [Allosphingosinicella sp.]|nr:cyclopropane-fatty-acyl-phospholipid synthase family protein [Allosphingosinicella sp.]
MWLLDRGLRRLIRRGQLTVIDHRGKTWRYGAPDAELAPVTVRFTDGKVPRQIARDPAVGAAEAFMDERLVVEQGEILDLVLMIRRNRRWEDRSRPNDFLRKGSKLARPLAHLNWKRQSKRNVAHHYDIGNEFYRLWLEADMQYSCGYFTDPGNSLEQAQLDKKIHLAAKLYLKPGQRVLDIGCGWGGLALFLNRVADVDVLGVTLSTEQLEAARARAAQAGVSDRVKFELMDYRDVTGTFDRIVSVGMFEHVGPPFFKTFFRKCRELLADDGVMVLHTMGRMGKPGTTDPFIQKYIWPGGYIPALSEILSASEPARLIMADCEALRLHYPPTIIHWYERFKAQKDEVVRLYDERFYRLWLFYLAAGLSMFSDGGMVVHQLQYLRRRDSVPITRDYMFEAEARMRGAALDPGDAPMLIARTIQG